jgi:amidophosphoribosyltransferase
VKLKHSANRAMIQGKRVVLVDDSIVRGTTSKKIVEMVRQAGAAEVHMRVSSPPTTHSCFYGIDTPERSQLMAAQHDVASMARIIGVDSLAFISLDGLYRALGRAGRDARNPGFCDACFTGDYAIPLTDWPEEARA